VPKKNRKVKGKKAKPEAPRAKRPATSERSSEQPARRVPPRRVHEVFGIITLAAALLLGPSLVSVQASDGHLMGPFGHAVGTVLHGAFGFGGHLLVLALLVVAVRIFWGGLSQEQQELSTGTLWRERIGFALIVLFATALLHLIARPYRIAGASAGGLVGEVASEILCSLASTPGAWVIALAGLALSLVLATNISWIRATVALFRAAYSLGGSLAVAWRRAAQQLGHAGATLAHALRRRELCADAQLAAMPPPVVRIDLSYDPYAPPEERPEPEEKEPPPLPQDLEIGMPAAPPPPPVISVSGEPLPRAMRVARGRQGKEPEAPTPEAPEPEPSDYELVVELEAPPASEDAGGGALVEAAPQASVVGEALTIVSPQFLEPPPAADVEDDDEKRVEQTDGPGFILFGDTYRPPPLTLLDSEERAESTIDKEAIYRQADRLVKTLSEYKIMGRVTEVHPGPVVTMYEFVPAPGTRISKIANLANDLAMSLAALRVRIVAPIPGKGAVGIEVPNDTRETVVFREIVAHDVFRKAKGSMTLAMGKNIVGAPITLDLARMPHLLVAGATGAGKSVSINTMICSLLLRNTPEEVRLIMVDPKCLELSCYNDIPHLLLPVVTDPKKANIALRWAVNEMERRYQLLADMKVRDIQTYNRKVDKLRDGAAGDGAEATAEPRAAEPLQEAAPSRILVVRKNEDGSEEPLGPVPAELAPAVPAQQPCETSETSETASSPASEGEAPRRKVAARLPRRLPYIVVVIDEFADLMMASSKDVETSVARLAQKARAAGIHVILATQRPSVDVITGLIKANFPSRISFQVASMHDSKTILGTQGAENLLGAGDMLVLDRGAEMKRLHGAYISDEEIRRVVDWLKEQGRPVYDMDILKPPPDEDEPEAGETDELADVMYDEAVALVIETRQASISMIQRRLRVGYNRAARMVERMEKEGVVSPPDHVKGREVLVPSLPQ